MANIEKNTRYDTYLEQVLAETANKPYRKNPSKVSYLAEDFEAETLYIGSRKRNSRMFCRIYDKKKEQLE